MQWLRRLAHWMSSVPGIKTGSDEGHPMTVIHTITKASGDRRVEFFRRDDGTFGFEPEIWLDEEECWVPHGRYSQCRVGSLEDAVSEAEGRVSWLRDECHGR